MTAKVSGSTAESAAASGGRQPFSAAAHARTIVGSISVVAFLAAWQLVGSHGIIDSALISYPSEILSALRNLVVTGELQRNAVVSLREFGEGFVPAIVFGIAAGMATALFRRLGYLVDPLFAMLYTAPMIAFIPIIVVWFGVGPESKVAVVFLSAIVPIVINAHAGVRSVSLSWVRALQAFGASPWQVITKAILPGSVPAIMAGIRLAVGRSIVSLIAAEMYVAIFGLGHMIQIYSTSDRAANLLVIVSVVSAFGVLAVSLLRVLEGRIAPWRAGR